MRLPKRLAAALLFALVLGLSPSFAQEDPRNLDYSGSDNGQCRAGESAVAEGKCTLSVPTGEGPVVAGIFPGTSPELMIPVELTLDGRLDGGEGFRPVVMPFPGFPNVEPNPEFPSWGGDDLFDTLATGIDEDTALRGGLAVIHGSEAIEDAPLMITITESGEIEVTDRVINPNLPNDPRRNHHPDAVDLWVESNADVTVINRGTLLSTRGSGIEVVAPGGTEGDITIRNSGVIAGARDPANEGEFLPASRGIHVLAAGTNDVTIEHTENGLIRVANDGSFASDGVFVRHTGSSGDIRITVGDTSVIEAGTNGIFTDPGRVDDGPFNGQTRVWVRVEEGARVSGERDGILAGGASGPDPAVSCDLSSSEVVYRNCVAVLGTVEGGSTEVAFSAAVVLRGSSILTIGPESRISTTGSAPAVRFANPSGLGMNDEPPAASIRYLVQHGRIGSIKGPVARGVFVDTETGRAAEIDYQFWVLADHLDISDLLDEIETGALSAKTQRKIRSVGEGGTFALGIYDARFDVETGEFIKTLAARAGVYEALPSVLLSVNRPISHDARRHAPRADGWWMWTEAADGSWKADRSTTNVKYDYDRYSFEVGVDRAVGEHAVVGLSGHHRNIDADTGGGSIEADGIGVGISATFTGDEAYVTGQASATWYEVDLSDAGVGTLRNHVDGFGYSIGAEVGRWSEHGDLVVAPRIGFTYSRIDLDDFQGRADPQLEITDSVSPDDGESFVGRVGIGFEHGKVYGSLDLEHEFSEDERRVEAEDAVLESESDDIWVRASLGGIHEWGEGRYSLNVQLGYASSGSDNDEFGGSLMLQGRF